MRAQNKINPCYKKVKCVSGTKLSHIYWDSHLVTHTCSEHLVVREGFTLFAKVATFEQCLKDE